MSEMSNGFTKNDFKNLRKEILDEAREIVNSLDEPPKLTIVSVGDDYASQIYVKNKIKTCNEVGIEVNQFTMKPTFD